MSLKKTKLMLIAAGAATVLAVLAGCAPATTTSTPSPTSSSAQQVASPDIEFMEQVPGGPAGFGYSQVVSGEGRYVFTAGQTALNENGEIVGVGDFAAQTRQAFENIRVSLAAEGASLDDLVRLNYFVTDINDLQVMRDVRDEILGVGDQPASSAVQVVALASPDFLIEIEAVALVPFESGNAPISFTERAAGGPEGFGYSQVVSGQGRVIRTAGQTAFNANGDFIGEGDFAAQTRQVFENIRVSLEAQGASLDDLVKLNYFVTDINDLQLMRDVRDEILGVGNQPASSAVQVAALALPEFKIEIEATAIIPSDSDAETITFIEQVPGGPAGFGYSQVVGSEGRIVITAGQTAFNANGDFIGEGDFAAQTRQVFENIRVSLEAQGASLDDLVKLNYFVTDINDLQLMRDVRDEILGVGNQPASSAVQVAALALPEFKIEIEATAVIPSRNK
ncbi:RidA family protein [Lysinibacter sp. HNR]|uniref:RidA family protein n=1 Tax=Lysinibacter sp. HNR TaxID=3031408 RepID=UPI0024350764|nr:RidA family protein [Lysinibacter sp. HNR]WGD36783.1 RidA family protein [Lysinibacter sp. HNR]